MSSHITWSAADVYVTNHDTLAFSAFVALLIEYYAD